MTVIKRGIVKSYDAGAHKAAVQIAGSLGVWLDGVRVATDIPAADVVPGRQCSVLFFHPSNPDDALVITIQGALPGGGGGGVTDHGALTGLGDDDHPQYGALAQAETVAGLWTFNAGIQLAAAQGIRDSGGTVRYRPSTGSPENVLTGDTVVSSRLRAGPAAPSGNTVMEATAQTGAYAGDVTLIKASHIGAGINVSGSFTTLRGVWGQPIAAWASGSTFGIMYGLQFIPIATAGGGGASLYTITGAFVTWQTLGYTGSITDGIGVDLASPYLTAGAAVANSTGLWIRDMGPSNLITNAAALKIDDLTANTGNKHLIEAGPVTPYLRLVGGAAPGANLTNLYLNENGTLRRVRWKAGNALGAADRVMVLV